MAYVFNRIPGEQVALGAALDAGHRRQRGLEVGHAVELHRGDGLIGHDDLDLATLGERLGGDDLSRVELLAVERQRLHAVTIAAHADREARAAIGEVVERAVGGESLRHEGGDAESVLLEMDAEEDALGQGEVAGEAPEHVARVELGVVVAVVEVEVLLVGGEESGGAEKRAYALDDTLLVAGLGLCESPVAAHERPQRVVVVVGHVGDLRVEDGGAEGSGGIALRYLLLAVGRSDVVEDRQGLAERLGARVEHHVVAAVGIHGVITLPGQVERAVDGGGEFGRAGGVIGGLLLLAEVGGHVGEGLEGGGIHHVGAHGFALRDVGGLHPLRVALLAPVDERSLALDEAAFGADGGVVLGDAAHGDGVDGLEPFAVAGHLIYLIGGEHPHDSVGRDGPGTARAGVLDDLARGVHLLHERDHRGLGLEGCHGEDDRIADVAGPDAGPFLAGAQGGVGFDGVDHLVEAHVVDGAVQEVAAFQHGVCREVVAARPFLADGHEISGTALVGAADMAVVLGPGLEFILIDGVALPAVGVGLHDDSVGRGRLRCDGGGCESRQGKGLVHWLYDVTCFCVSCAGVRGVCRACGPQADGWGCPCRR